MTVVKLLFEAHPTMTSVMYSYRTRFSTYGPLMAGPGKNDAYMDH